MRRLGMLFVGDTSRHTLEAAAGDYSTLCTLLMLLAEALKGEGITDTLEGDTLTIRVKHLELLLLELHRDTEEAKHLDSLLEHTSRGTLGMLSLQKAGGEPCSLEAERGTLKGDYSTLLAAVKVLKAPLKALFSVGAHFVEAGANAVRIEKKGAFELLAIELDSQSSAGAAPQKKAQEKLGAFCACNLKTGAKEDIIGDYSTLVSVIDLIEKAFTRPLYYGIETNGGKIGDLRSLFFEYEDGEQFFVLQAGRATEGAIRSCRFSRGEITPERGTLRLFFKADGECYEREVNYSTCRKALLATSSYLEDLFDIYTDIGGSIEGGSRGEVIAASSQIILRLELKQEEEE